MSTGSQKTFNIEVTVPDSKRFAKLKAPKLDRLISIRGMLASISTHEEIAGLELEGLTFILTGSGNAPSGATTSNQTTPGGKSKRQFCADRVISPMKKVKVGPASAFVGANGSKGLDALE
ncbi:hypothetical protein FRC10_010703 [Ceratobasidium sp. 414]|nr:hypothetical protein FRC10_010703 [Ceratobasidium sp. 414]